MRRLILAIEVLAPIVAIVVFLIAPLFGVVVLLVAGAIVMTPVLAPNRPTPVRVIKNSAANMRGISSVNPASKIS